MYELQETKNAHVNPTDDLFLTVSRHRTAEKAIEEEAKHLKRMHKACGNGWSHNHRVINVTTGNIVEWRYDSNNEPELI